MKGTQGNLFSQDRFLLFTGNGQKFESNDKFAIDKKNRQSQVLTPSDKAEQKQFLLLIIQKRDTQIRELKRKLRICETNLTQTRQKLDSTNYELEYFKRKISEQIEKSKETEIQIDQINRKVLQMINNLSCVKKLKNPIELRQHSIDWQLVAKKMQVNKGNQRPLQKLDIQCIQILDKVVEKVANVIQSAFKLKKQKSQKILVQMFSRPPEHSKVLSEKKTLL